MNAKGTRFLAILAVFAMAFAGIAVLENADFSDAAATEVTGDDFLKTEGNTVADVTVEDNVTTYKLKVDVILTTTAQITGKVIIDLNDHDITGKDIRALQIKSDETLITGEGKISVSESSIAHNQSVIRVGQNADVAAKLTINEKVTVESVNIYTISVFNGVKDTEPTTEVELVVKGTVNHTGNPENKSNGAYGESTAIAGCGNPHNGVTKITIEEGAVINAPHTNSIYFPCAGTLTIEGTLTGGIESKSGIGEVVVGDRASVTKSDQSPSHVVNGDGCSTRGYAIAMVENSAYKGSPSIEINGGIITGNVAIVKDSDVGVGKEGYIEINGGTINGTVSKVESPAGDIEVNGGKFTDLSAAEFLVDNGVLELTKNVTLTGNLTTGKGIVKLSDGVKITGTTQTVTGTIARNADQATFEAFSATTSFEITTGSVCISGTGMKGAVTVTGTVDIFGTADGTDNTATALTINLKNEAKLIVPEGKDLKMDNLNITLDEGAKASFTIIGSISGQGDLDAEALTGLTVAASDPVAAALVIGDEFDIKAYGAIVVKTEEELLNAVELGYTEIILGDSFSITADLELDDTATIDLAGYELTVALKKELTLEGTKVIDSSEKTEGLIRVLGFLTLDSADVCANVTPYDTDSIEKGYITVTGAKEMTVTGTLNSNIAVGYGNTLIVTDLTVPAGMKVSVFGDMTANGTLTIASDGKVVINTYATAEINATTNVEGTFINNGGTIVNGNVTVYKAAGGAVFTNNGVLTLSITSTLNVTAGRQSGAADNVFNAGFAYLYGTALITGTMNGTLIDYGDLTFNGKAGTSAKIQLRNGVELNVLSVTGTLTVTDYNAAKADTWDYSAKYYKKYVRVYDGNEFVLMNVKGLTITQSTVVTPVVEDGVTYKYYASTLTLSGISSSVVSGDNHSIAVDGGEIQTKLEPWKKTIPTGSANIGDLTIGAEGTITFGNDAKTVSGTLQAVAKHSKIDFGQNNTTNTTVLGSVYSNNKSESQGIANYEGSVDAAFYMVTDSEGYVHKYLTTFKDALDVISTVDDMTITVYGKQNLAKSDSYEVPALATVVLYNDCELTIKGDLKIVKNGTLDGSSAKIKVEGLLAVEDKNTGLKSKSGNFKYQVFVENGDSVKYYGIARAIADSTSGDTITMVQDGEIKASITIPEGVTVVVPRGIQLEIGSTTGKITVTVDGVLQMKRTGNVVEAEGAEDVALKINGAVIADDDSDFDISEFVSTGYVYFDTTIDGRNNTVYSNIEYAALVVTGGTVTVVGSVSASEVTFKKTGDEDLLILVPATKGDVLQNILAVGTLTLVDATLYAAQATDDYENPGLFSGEVVALSADDTASITMVNATGFVINSKVTEVASGYEYAMNFGAITDQGIFVVSEGTVYVSLVTITNAPGETKASLTIDEGAVLVVPEDCALVYEASPSVDDPYIISNMFEINGTLVAEEDSIVDLDGVEVNGLFDVQTAAAKIGNAYINGTIQVTENEADDSLLTIAGYAYVWGDADSIGSAATITGAVEITDNGALMVYPGADIIGAYINWNKATGKSDAVHTAYYVNEELYMIAFASQGTNVLALVPIYIENYDLIGIEFGVRSIDVDGPAAGSAKSTGLYKYTNWFFDISMTPSSVMGVSAKIGQYEAFYADAEAATVEGTITVGVGLTLYVDGVGYIASQSDKYEIPMGIHKVYVELQSGYVGDKVTIKFNGVNIPATATGGTIEITPEMTDFSLVATGAEPYVPEPTPEPEKESEWTVTTILLCVLVVLIAIMAVIVALRLNRN